MTITEWLHLINGSACAFIGLFLMYCILSTRVHDKLLVKCGLISMALGFLASAWFLLDDLKGWNDPGMTRAQLLINGGLVIGVIAYARRRKKAGRPIRRITDFATFDE